MRSLAEEARAARRGAVLDEAAQEINRAGVSGASFAAIARRVGLTRASLYNYCSDREDLAYQCYLRACTLTQADLRRAAATPGSGLDRLIAFLRLTLDFEHPPMAALSAPGFLSPNHQAEVRSAQAANVQALSDIIKQGIHDGSMRACDVDLACQAVWGMLAWAPLSRIWTGNSGESFAIRMAAALPAVIVDGIAAGGAADIDAAPTLPAVAEALRGQTDDRREVLAKAASRLFNQRGVDGVSLDDVAAALGATKGLVYHHFAGKLDLVAHCYERAFRIYDAVMTVAEGADSGLAASRLVLELNGQAQLADLHPLSLSTGFESLPATLQKRSADRTNQLTHRAEELGRRGVRDGSLKPFDLQPTSLAAAGVFSYLAKWLPDGDNRPPAAVAREVANVFLYGLRRRPG